MRAIACSRTCEQCEHFQEYVNASIDDWRGRCRERHFERDGDEPACKWFEEATDDDE